MKKLLLLLLASVARDKAARALRSSRVSFKRAVASAALGGTKRKKISTSPEPGEGSLEGDALVARLQESRAGRLILKTLKDEGRPPPQRVPTMVELIETTERTLEQLLMTKAEEDLETALGPKSALADFGLRQDETSLYLNHLELLTAPKNKQQSEILPESTADPYTVAIVLGKALKAGRISVEMASRVSALVRAMKDGFEPDLVVFAPSSASRAGGDYYKPSHAEMTGVADDASVACAYFVHHCELMGIEVADSKLYVGTVPLLSREAMRRLMVGCIYPRIRAECNYLRKELGFSHGLAVSFFGSEYLLQRFERVQHVTPRLSLFAPLGERNEQYKRTLREASKSQTAQQSLLRRKKKLSSEPSSDEVIGPTTWFLESVKYPPRLLTEPVNTKQAPSAMSVVFLARAHVILDSLVPLLLNLRAVVQKEEFLSRDYFEDLVLARRLLAEHLALLESPMRPAEMRRLPVVSALSSRQLAEGARSSAAIDANVDGFLLDDLDDPQEYFNVGELDDCMPRTKLNNIDEYDPSDDHSDDEEEEEEKPKNKRREKEPDVVEEEEEEGKKFKETLMDRRRRDAPLLASEAERSPLLDEALERIILWLSELARLLRPAATRTGSLSPEEWTRSLRLLQKTMQEGRAATDPDRALAASEWGRLLDDDDLTSSPNDFFAFDWHLDNDEVNSPFVPELINSRRNNPRSLSSPEKFQE